MGVKMNKRVIMKIHAADLKKRFSENRFLSRGAAERPYRQRGS